ncbi:MAG TPA: PaaI family thioesterase [Deltaproteobacteria bacterium]|nr:PaaI family thioesterase [Deltaproteobacteria bacterium]
MERKGLKQLPSRGDHNCFGCSPVNPSGLHMRFFTDGEGLFSWVSVPDHLCGWKDLAHGGVITAILDEIMGWSAIYLLKCVVLTKSIAIDFVKPVHVGTLVRAEAKLAERTQEREVIVEGLLFDGEKTLCAKARGTFAVFAPEVAERLGIMDEATRAFIDLVNSS